MSEQSPDLREFVKEHDRLVVEFCTWVLNDSFSHEAVILEIFREFGEQYRRRSHQPWEVGELRVQLFQVAWRHIQRAAEEFQLPVHLGRDTRPLQDQDEDLLHASRLPSADRVVQRLALVDLPYRAPVVLRDLLHLADEEVVRILGLRWGVYRHRLHRGRLDLADYLRGLSAPRTHAGFARDSRPPESLEG